MCTPHTRGLALGGEVVDGDVRLIHAANYSATQVKENRIAADRPFYSGKHRMHGVNL
ncbi:hypothetical protein APASM_4591 [Actinosynnema pretiosum subsp. pretiosum]|nr:hypothetical protein APASM_4591 [Actinosynnema pretiosum subsp. pretiosum]